MMLKKTMILVALSAVSAFAGASELDARQEARQVVDLQDGSTLYVFDNGKTALQNKYGQAVSVTPGSSLKAKDGKEVRTVGNEVARLDYLLKLGMGV